MIIEQRVLEIFEETNGLLTGHFRLRSGLHSTKFLQTAVVLQYPEIASMLCNQVASRLQKDLNRDADGIDIVMGPAIGGVILAHEVARSLNCRAMFGEKSDDDMILRPGFEIRPNDQVVIIDDVLTTGGSVARLISLCQQFKAEVVATAFLIDRSSNDTEITLPLSPPLDRSRGQVFQSASAVGCLSSLTGIPKVALATIDIPTYQPSDCPMCQGGPADGRQPLTEP